MLEELLKVLLLAVVQGITEFLPISSTGHLVVLSRFVELGESYRSTFEIFIQLGAVVAVLAYYRSELWQQARTITTDRGVLGLWLRVAVAFVPAGALGFLFNDWIEQTLFNPRNVALALIAGGILFLLVERTRPSAPDERTREELLVEIRTMPYWQALVIGLWQILALFPGMSRSGMTIIGGMIAGLSRATVTMFTFYLAIPTLGIATVYTLLSDLDDIAPGDLLFLGVGTVASAIVSYIAIGWLLRYISRNTFVPFGIYRILLGIVILLFISAGLL